MVSNDKLGWKTRNGDGPKLMNKFDTKISIIWDNNSIVEAWLKDKNTITMMH